MTNSGDGHDKFGSEYPLPGGVQNYFETLVAMLRFVRDNGVTYEGLVDWFSASAGATGATAVSGYISSIGRLGLWAYQEDQIKLTPVGVTVVTSIETDIESARKLIIELKYKLIAGYEQLFELLASGNQSTETIHAALQNALAVEWKTRNQTAFRINWLRSLGYADKDGMLFHLTEAGRSVRQSLLGTLPLDPPRPSGGDRQPKATALEMQANAIAEKLKLCSTAGGDGKDFEEATQAAFAFLGFDTQLIGGSGNPDVLANASMGEKSYRVSFPIRN